MTVIVTDVIPRVQTTYVGGPTTVNFSFLVYTASDLNVYMRAPNSIPDDAANLLTLNTDYTVAIVPQPGIGGVVTITSPLLAVNYILTVVRNQPDQRLNNYADGKPFLAQDVNSDFNQTILMTQQNKMYDLNITPHYNVNASLVQGRDTMLPTLQPGCVWWMNGSGTAIESLAVTNPVSRGVVLPTANEQVATFRDGVGTIGATPVLIDISGNVSNVTSLDVINTINTTGDIITPFVSILSNGDINQGAGDAFFTNATISAAGDLQQPNSSISAAGALVLPNAGVTVPGASTAVSYAVTNGGFSVKTSAPVLAGDSAYTAPPVVPTQDSSQFLTSTIAGVQSWAMGAVTVRKNVTSAQILNMYTAPVEILPAAPANTVYAIHSYCLFYTFVSAAYAGNHNIFLQFTNTANAGGFAASTVISSVLLLDQVSSIWKVQSSAAGPYFVNSVGQNICLTNLGANFTVGDGTLIVYVTYTIVPSI